MPTRMRVGVKTPLFAAAILKNVSSYTSAPSPVTYTFSPTAGYSAESALFVWEFIYDTLHGWIAYWIHLAVADGPNHSPGGFPHADAPCWTNLCIEKGAFASSANNDKMCCSLSSSVPRRQSIDMLDNGRRGDINSPCLFPIVRLITYLQGDSVPIESYTPNQSLR